MNESYRESYEEDVEGPGAIGGIVMCAPLGWASWAGLAALAGATGVAKGLGVLALLSLPLAARVAWVWRKP